MSVLHARIVKSAYDWRVPPNLRVYEEACATFSWGHARAELDGVPAGGLNIAHEAVDRHATGPRQTQLALRWISKSGVVRDFTYGDLRDLSSRFANVLRGLGIGQGDRVFVLAGRIPELYIAALGTLKNRSVFCPLYSAFGPEPVRSRIEIGQAKVLVVTQSLYEKKVAPQRAALSSLEQVLVVSEAQEPTDLPGTRDFHALMEQA